MSTKTILLYNFIYKNSIFACLPSESSSIPVGSTLIAFVLQIAGFCCERGNSTRFNPVSFLLVFPFVILERHTRSPFSNGLATEFSIAPAYSTRKRTTVENTWPENKHWLPVTRWKLLVTFPHRDRSFACRFHVRLHSSMWREISMCSLCISACRVRSAAFAICLIMQ